MLDDIHRRVQSVLTKGARHLFLLLRKHKAWRNAYAAGTLAFWTQCALPVLRDYLVAGLGSFVLFQFHVVGLILEVARNAAVGVALPIVTYGKIDRMLACRLAKHALLISHFEK